MTPVEEQRFETQGFRSGEWSLRSLLQVHQYNGRWHDGGQCVCSVLCNREHTGTGGARDELPRQ